MLSWNCGAAAAAAAALSENAYTSYKIRCLQFITIVICVHLCIYGFIYVYSFDTHLLAIHTIWLVAL